MAAPRHLEAEGGTMTRRKSRSWKIRIDNAAMLRVAAALVEDHDARLAEGWAICPASGLWRTRSGTITARIAYRLRAEGASMVYTIRGINLGALTDE